VRPCLPLRPAVGKSTTSAGEPGWGLDFLILSATWRPPGRLLWAHGFASPPHDGFAIIEDEEDETTMRRRGPAEEGECRSRRTTHDRPVPPRRECSRNKPPLEEVAPGPSNRQGGEETSRRIVTIQARRGSTAGPAPPAAGPAAGPAPPAPAR